MRIARFVHPGSATAPVGMLWGAVEGPAGADLDALTVAAIDESLPPYRQQHRHLNVRALDAGIGAAPGGLPSAWTVLEEAR